MTSQGSASDRFTRAIERRNLFAAEIALREMGTPSLLVALDYVILLAEFALAAFAALCGGDRGAIGVLRRLLRKVRPTLLLRVTG